MQTEIQSAPAPAVRIEAARAARVESQLRRYPASIQPRVRLLAARCSRLGDLAVSFPALLAALATSPRDEAIALVLDGAPLARVAAAAQVPMWTRALTSDAFAGAIPTLPDSLAFRRQIANHLPKRRNAAAQWLQWLGNAYAVADEPTTLWAARELAHRPFPKPVTRRRYRPRRKLRMRWRLICLWAWFSQRPDTFAHTLIETPWCADMAFKTAESAAQTWQENLALYVEMGRTPVSDAWLQPGEIDGFAFAPILSAEDLLAEAQAMKNCLRTYGYSIAENYSRPWSVRKDGERVATLELRAGEDSGLIELAQIRVLQDKAASAEIIAACRTWFLTQPEHARVIEQPKTVKPFDRATWIAIWRPYWIAKRRIPHWLPLNPSYGAFYDL